MGGVKDSRQLLITFLTATKTTPINTWFDKPPSALCTYRSAGTPLDYPCRRPEFQTLDYCIVPQRWRNMITNCYADHEANLASDHYPLILHLRLRLKAMTKKQQPAERYLAPTSSQLLAYKNEITTQLANAPFHPDLLTNAAKQHFTKIPPRTPFYAWSHESQKILDKRAYAIASQNTKATYKLTKALRKQKRIDTREAIAKMYHEDLDIRDQWCGLRFLRRDYAPAPYHRCNTEKRHVPMPLRAHAAAEYLATNQWHPPTDPNPVLPGNPLAPRNTTYDTSPITLEEVQQSIKRIKKTQR